MPILRLSATHRHSTYLFRTFPQGRSHHHDDSPHLPNAKALYKVIFNIFRLEVNPPDAHSALCLFCNFLQGRSLLPAYAVHQFRITEAREMSIPPVSASLKPTPYLFRTFPQNRSPLYAYSATFRKD